LSGVRVLAKPRGLPDHARAPPDTRRRRRARHAPTEIRAEPDASLERSLTLESPHRPRGLVIRGLVLMQPLDLVISLLVVVFFVTSALVSGGDVVRSVEGALLIMLVMLAVGASIEVIIESLRAMPGLGTAVGFITNGPEALVLVVGLLGDDIIFAASTPLGSNFMNPIMLLSAGLVGGAFAAIFARHRGYTILTLLVSAVLAGGFFLLGVPQYLWWTLVTVPLSLVLFWRRPDDPADSETADIGLPRWTAIPAVVLLVVAGYFLDPVVSLTAEASRAPKGVIGFVVLAALTSWPEFRSCLTLLRRRRTVSAVLNITVSNLTNLWLAAMGVVVYLLTH
jgi:cation:H+ antiporter